MSPSIPSKLEVVKTPFWIQFCVEKHAVEEPVFMTWLRKPGLTVGHGAVLGNSG